MNAFMNINVRVNSARGIAELRKLQAEMRRTTASGAAANTGLGRIGNQTANLRRFGNQLQWTGRQLELNFTLPLLLAVGAATKFALENEKAMTRIVKVYGDGTMAMSQIRSETNALSKAMVALSNRFGIAQKDALNIAADWAQAGASGIALARSVEQTMRIMVLGEMDAAEATKALISIQAQYGLNTKQLAATIDELNMIENQTGISMQGLVEGFEKSAGMARSAGISTRYLGAMLAAMTPAAGSAAQAGNALKTLLSRIMAPTKDAAAVMGKFGINVESVGWQSLNGAKRLEALAKAWDTLTGSQKVAASATIASRWQINRFNVLMEDMGNYLKNGTKQVDDATKAQSYYGTALDSTSNAQRNFNQAQFELNQVLSSNPQRLKIMWTILQNAMADVVQPLIPYIVYLAQKIAELAKWFSNLDPAIQKTIGVLALFLALVGPIARYIGAWLTLMSVMHSAFGLIGTAFIGVGKGLAKIRALFIGFVTFYSKIPAMIAAISAAIRVAFTTPWVIAVAAVIAVLVAFRDQIGKFLRNLSEAFGQVGQNIADSMGGAVNYAIKAFYALPEGVQRALIAVVNIVQRAAMAVYELFSYFNPWAHHSPSLVESVVSGMNAILKAYGGAKKVGQIFAQSIRDLERFKKLAAAFQMDEFGRNRRDVASTMPSALPLYDRMVKQYRTLDSIADAYSKKVDKQSAVVAKWSSKLDAANKKLDAQQKALSSLQDQLSKTQDLMQSYQDAITNYANAPIEGMKEFSDAIFQNSMEQKKLQLQLLDLGGTDSIDKLREKYDKLTGDIEVMMGRVGDLRAAGAGSEVLGPLQDQIAAMKAAQGNITGQVNSSPITALQQQLEALQTQAERLDLQQSLKFDPLTRQVDQLVNGMKELPFNEIIDGIKKNQAAMATLQPTLDSQTAAVARQQDVVDKLTESRDKLQDTYDTEKQKLDDLTDAMQKYADQAQAIKSALTSISGEASGRISRARSASGVDGRGPGERAFDAGALGDFPKVGGKASLGREGGPEDQSKLIEEFAKQKADELAQTFGTFDFFKPIRDKWNQFTKWFSQNVTPVFAPLGHIFDGIDISSGLQRVQGFFKGFGDLMEKIGKLFIPDVRRAWEGLQGKWQKAVDTIGPELSQFRDVWSGLWSIIKVVASVLGVVFISAVKQAASIISNTIGPVIDGAIDLIADLIRIIRGVVEVVVGIFTGDWDMAWKGAQDIVKGTIEGIGHILETAASVIWGIAKGIVEGVMEFFQWLFDVLIGHSIIPDLMNGIVKWFNWLITPIKKVLDWLGAGWDIVKNGWDKAWSFIKDGFSAWWSSVKKIGETVWGWFSGTFSKLIDVVKSAWNHSWDAIKDFVTNFWPRLKGALQTIYDWVHDILGSVIDKVKDKFSKSWEAISNWFKTNGKKMLQPLVSAINMAIDGVNTLIKGLNKVADVLPGLDWNIGLIPHFAAGGVPGRRVGSGFKTVGARAIVGEGKANHPEFVIPTDPTYRNRAKGLYAQLGKYLGIPQLAGGGILGSIKDALGGAANVVSGIGDRVKDVALGLVSEIMKPVKSAAYGLIDKIGWNYGRRMARSAADSVFGWVTMADKAVKDKVDSQRGPGGTVGGSSAIKAFLSTVDPKPYVWGAVGPDAYDCSGLTGEVYNRMKGIASYTRRFTTASNFSSLGFLPGPGGTYTIGVNPGTHMAGEYGGFKFEAASTTSGIKVGGAARSVMSFAQQFHMASGGIIDLFNQLSKRVSIGGDIAGATINGRPLRYDSGGWLKPGMTRVMNTSGKPEPVFSSAQWSAINRAARLESTTSVSRRDSGVTEIHFHGDLSFPNIKTGEDAETFLKNLKSLAGGA